LTSIRRARNPDNWNAWQTDAQAGAVGIGFTGHRAELDHGLIDADGRMYDPSSGRFMAPDPLVTQAYAGAAYNRYAYVGNRPLRFTDPSGWAASDEDESEGESASFADVVLGFFDEIEDLKTELDQATRNAVSSSPLETVEAYYETTLAEPAAFVWDGLRTNIDNAVEGAKAIAEDPVGAAVEMGKGVANDVKTVVVYPLEVGAAAARGDGTEAMRLYLNAVRSAWSLAALATPFVGGATGGFRSLTVKGPLRPMTRSLGAAGDDLLLKKAVNTGLPHATKRGVQRGVFANPAEAGAALRDLTSTISKSKTFPTGTLVDTAHAGRFLVPVGNNGLAVYQMMGNGTARLKTVLNAR
jgi:RHS repeat-associated protein